MSIANGIVMRPDRFAADVQATLGERDANIKTLCRSHYINMWSLPKPVVLAQNFPDRNNVDVVDDKFGVTKRVPEAWYRGDDHQCGFRIVQYASADAVANPSSIDWQYIRPRGGEKEPFRIDDFNGYWHEAPPPYSGLNLPNVVYAGQSCTVSLARGLQPAEGSPQYHHNVTLADIYIAGIGWMNELVFGCLLRQVNSDGSETRLANVEAARARKTSVAITIPSNVAEGTQLRFVPYYCSRQFDSNGRPLITPAPKYFSIPGMSSQYATANSKTGSVTEATGFNTSIYGIFSTYPSHSGNGYNIGALVVRAGATTTGDTAIMSNAVVRVWHGGRIVWYENITGVTFTPSSPWQQQWIFHTPLAAGAGGGWATGGYEVEFNCTLRSVSGSKGGTFNKKIRVLRPVTSGDVTIVD